MKRKMNLNDTQSPELCPSAQVAMKNFATSRNSLNFLEHSNSKNENEFK